MAFSATDAAFEGFRVVRRHPMALVFWTLFYIVVMAVAFAVVGGNLIGLTAAAERLEAAGGTPTPEDFMPLMQGYMSVFAVLAPLSLAAGAVLYAAIVRSVLRPTEKAFGYMRLGMDEVRVLVVSLALMLLFMVGAAVVFGIVGVMAGFASAGGGAVMWILAVLLALAGVAGFVWLAVRLSLAIPITVAERRFAILDSFKVTKGLFWPLLGMALLAGVMSMVVSLLGTLIFLPVEMATGGLKTLAALEGQSLTATIQAAWPAVLGWIIVNAVMSALQVAVVYAPFSAAYRDIIGQKPNAAVFD
jgi:hypothetical protein